MVIIKKKIIPKDSSINVATVDGLLSHIYDAFLQLHGSHLEDAILNKRKLATIVYISSLRRHSLGNQKKLKENLEYLISESSGVIQVYANVASLSMNPRDQFYNDILSLLIDASQIEDFIERMRKIEYVPRPRLIEKRPDGRFTYNGLVIDMGNETDPYVLLDALWTQDDDYGRCISYERIDQHFLENRRECIDSKEAMKQRISNARDELMRKKVGRKTLTELCKNDSIIAVKWGEGFIFHNPPR